MKILVVDDSPSFAKMIMRFLQELGYSDVDTALSVREALNLTRENVYDLVFLDYYLPDGDGCDVGRNMMRRGVAKRVILISVSREISCEDFGVIEKPVSLESIRREIIAADNKGKN